MAATQVLSRGSSGSSSAGSTSNSRYTAAAINTARRRQTTEDGPIASTSASTSVDASPPAIRRPKRGPLQSVCLHCRKAKLRCDRESPCMHCRKQSVECVYPSFEPEAHEDGGGGSVRRRRRRANPRIQPAAAATAVAAIAPLPSQPFDDPLAWRDHLFSFFPGSRTQTQRTLVRLFRSIPALIYREHYFHLFHMDAPIHAITHSASTLRDYPLDVHPALVYALVAFALRMRLRPERKAGSLLPLEGVPVPADRDDVALRIQREAEVLLSQSLTDPFVGVNKALSVGQAAAMVMKLQPEFTHSHSFYWTIVHQLTTSGLFRSYTDDEGIAANGALSIQHAQPPAQPTNVIVHRDSIRAENAARLRLITLWTSLRQGYVFPNFEVLMGRFTLQDIEHATVYTPFVDEVDAAEHDVTQIIRTKQEQAAGKRSGGKTAAPASTTTTTLRYDLGADDQSGLLHPLSFRGELFRFVTRCTTSWQIAELNYASPSADFAALLASMDQRDTAGRVMQLALAASTVARPALLKQLFAKRVVACAYLQGFLIRRIGIAHSAAIRPYVVHAMGGDAKVDVLSPAWQRPFDSPTLSGWVELMRTFLHEVDEDYKAAIAPPTSTPPMPTPLSISHFTLDSLLLYAAASEQYGQGVAQVYRLLGHPQPTTQPLAQALFDVANALRLYVHRHRALHHQRGNLGPEPVRIAL